MSNQHILKIHPAPLADLLSGAKTAEVRRNDRDFQVGDTVRLMEVNPETLNWTGRPDLVRTISHIQTGYGLPDGMCVLSYAQAEQQEAKPATFYDAIVNPPRLPPRLKEAQGAQAGDRQAKPGLYCRNCGSRLMVKGVCSIYCPNKNCERDRAALATQPADDRAREMGYRSAINALDDLDRYKMAMGPATAAPEATQQQLNDLNKFFNAVCEGGLHSVEKAGIQSLTELGALENCGFGKHRLTRFGTYLLEQPVVRGAEHE